MSTLVQQNMQRLTVSSQHVNLDDFSQAELPELSSTSADDHSEGIILTSTGLASPGLQSILSAESEGKETYRTSKIRSSIEKEMGSPSVIEDHKEVVHTATERKKTRPWLFFIIGAIACLIIGLAVGLGVGLTRKSSTTSTVSPTPTTTPTSSGGVTSPTPNNLSTVGAFNGTGIALASESFGSEASGNGTYGLFVLYFQHHTGSIRQMQLRDSGWEGGGQSDIVVPAEDVKNGTPISAVSYALNNTAAWHIFYIAPNNTIQEMTNGNTTNEWKTGPINSLNLQTIDDPNVGLQGSWYGNYYGAGTTGDSSDLTIGIHLWYGKNSTTFGSVAWAADTNTWTQEEDFNDYNSHAGVACYTWGPGSNIYVMFVNLQNEVNILWKDLNTTLKNTTTHPIDVWTKSSVSIPVFQNTSMGYTDFLFAQNPDLSIGGWNISYSAENTSVLTDQNFAINVGANSNGLPGTHLTNTAIPDGSGGAELQAFYQTNGTNIQQVVRDLAKAQWYELDVPIPDS